MSVTTRLHVIGSLISEEVTDETLAAAKAGNRDAAASILAELESRFSAIARRTVARTEGDASDGLRDAYTEDFLQEAHVIALECLAGYEGDSVDAYRAYAFTYVERELAARGRDMLNGTDDDSDGKKLFAQMVKHFRAVDVNHSMTAADYVNLAESAVQDKGLVATLNGGVYKSRIRMSPEAAYAARLAYQGMISIFTPTAGEDAETTIADTLVDADTVESAADATQAGYRPVQWVIPSRTLEATLVLPRHEGARTALLLTVDRFRAGTVTEEDLDLVEALPCRSAELGAAVDMLRALFNQRQEEPSASSAETQEAAALGRGSVALNAQRAILEKATEDAVKRALVRRVLGLLSPRQAYIMAATFGFMGKFKDDAQVAREMSRAGIADIDASRVRKDRDKARAAFTKKWADLVAKTGSERHALEAAAAKTGVSMEDALAED
ncbi:RNA polymerase sigma factor [Streptomyces phage phiSASD1]|uniref:Gp13 n=1 Tax=Streptomyces phage phiSASD1 TaxID=747763 RepID=D7NW82_9CAUD|nr:RNA polymerase sigma factor [Streptomyces phage phiSASD1]ADE43480.1 gp13 [Streptomyces phage phiSASD1]